MLSPKDILEMAWGFMRSRVLFTAAELDLFTYLDQCHYTAAELAATAGLEERALTRLLDALLVLGLLSKEGGRYRLTEAGAVGFEPAPQIHPADAACT